MTEVTYTISELAKEFNITPRTIQFYEDEGLISPARKGIKRIYNKKDKVHLKLIVRRKRLEFSLSEFRIFTEMYHP
ncbi:MAG: MerR family transcriptional regulator [Endozoicomonas sp.]